MRTFSLRALLMLVTASAPIAWGWARWRDRPEARLHAALALIERENPGADIHYSRSQAMPGLIVSVRSARRISASLAHALGRASLIGYVRFRAGSVDGLLGDVELSPEARRELEHAFVSVVPGSFEVTCQRTPDPRFYERLVRQRAADW